MVQAPTLNFIYFFKQFQKEKEKEKSIKKSRKSKGRDSTASHTNSPRIPRASLGFNKDDDEDMGVVGAEADDQEAEYIRSICETEIGKGNRNFFSNHHIALGSFFKNLVKWQQDFLKSRQMATRFLKISSNGNKIKREISSNGNKIFKNLVKWQQDL